jgi:sugar diacid utilization regulator
LRLWRIDPKPVLGPAILGTARLLLAKKCREKRCYMKTHARVRVEPGEKRIQMQLSDSFWEMAERFVEYIHRETGLNTIVCDDRGIIQKAYQKQRIGQPHAGAQKILSTAIREIAISKEEERRNPLTKEGLNCAIVIDGAKVATFGIAGKLEIVTPVAKTAALVMAGWVKQLHQQDLLQATAEEVTRDLGLLTEKIEGATGKFEHVSQTMMLAAKETSTSVTTTDRILDAVQRIAQQTYLLSINASIEAGRLGEQGRAFASVAEEMTRLSQNAKESMQTVQNTIDNIQKAVSHVDTASRQSAALFAENVDTMRAIAPMFQKLMTSIKTLENSFEENVN